MATPRRKWHLVYLPITLVAYLAAVIGLGATAIVVAAGDSWSDAMSHSAGSALNQPMGTLCFLLPFLGADLLAVEVAHRQSSKRAAVLFLVVIAALMWLFYDGLLESQRALLQQRWTASSISLAMIVVWSAPVLLIAAIAAGGLKWKFGTG